jgi:hypothetical protein
MPIFISYSHQDREFVDIFASHLVKAKAHVWVDRWELHVGDSILNRVQDAIKDASALIMVLSKASVSSEWCKKELTAGLMRELEEKKVVVLPVLIEDCEIPLLLRDKLYADFRKNFDEGLRVVLESIARLTSETQGRSNAAGSDIDWAIDWGYVEKRFMLKLTLIERAKEQPYTALTEVSIIGNHVATGRYEQYVEVGLDWLGRQIVIETISWIENLEDLAIILPNQLPVTREFILRDPKTKVEYEIHIISRWIGVDTGRDVLVRIGGQLVIVMSDLRKRLRKLSDEETMKLAKLLSNPVSDR